MTNTMSPKERIHATIAQLPVDRTPVTPIFMAWAAHYIHRTYRDYYLEGDVLAQSNLAVAGDFNIDQVSAISDPWREADDYGMQFDYPPEGVGKPKAHLLNTAADIDSLRNIDTDHCPRMNQRAASIAQLAAAVGDTHSVLGWLEGPIAEYVDLRGINQAMVDLVDQPAFFTDAADVLVDNAIKFARQQAAAGADMIAIGDAAASLIGPQLYEQLVLPYQKKLFAAIHELGPKVKLHICGNITDIIALMATTDADVIDVDWMVPLDYARSQVGQDITLCGNFDPAAVLLQGTPAEVTTAAQQCIAAAGSSFILMPGCEVPPGTPTENLRAFCPNDATLNWLSR